MSKSAEHAQTPANFIVQNMAGKWSKQATKGQEESSSTRQRSHVSSTVFTRLGVRDRNVFTRLKEKKRDIHCWDIKTKDFIDAVKDYYCYWLSWKRLSVSAVSVNC
nr:hypothetical protein [Tanacetum cinerariifolium]